MASKFTYGTPYEPEPLLGDFSGDIENPFDLKEEGKVRTFLYHLDEDDVVYGLGESMRGINKRPGLYISYNCDNGHQEDDTKSLYSSHNFIIVFGKKPFGAFFSTGGRVTFDIDSKGDSILRITAESDLNLYLYEGKDPLSIDRQFLSSFKRSFIPPFWAFGYGQSRWSYKNEREVRKMVEKHKKHGFPLDYVCLDIHYMKGLSDFTFSPKRFPYPKKLIGELKEQNIYVVPVVDAGVKIAKDEKPYQEGIHEGAFCLNHEGKPFIGYVWPGQTHFPDVLNKKGREHFGRQYAYYLDLGIEGFWNDMNEPSIFLSEYTKGKRRSEKNTKGDNPNWEGVGFNEDYHHFYQVDDKGNRYLHHEVHNYYGGLQIQGVHEYLEEVTKRRYLLFSRSSYIGSHVYGGLWTGDNRSDFEHLAQNLRELPSISMVGFLYTGADTGGFAGNCDKELMQRWLELSLWAPLYRNHSCIFTRRQELYRYRHPEDFLAPLRARYALLPYIYSEFMKAALRNEPLIRPLAFDYPEDKEARNIEDQILFGEGVMVAPIIKRGATSRTVYLPEDMTKVTYDGENFLEEGLEKGNQEIEMPLGKIIFFIKKDKAVIYGKPASNTAELRLEEVSFLGQGKTYDQYLDDGFTKEVDEKKIRRLKK